MEEQDTELIVCSLCNNESPKYRKGSRRCGDCERKIAREKYRFSIKMNVLTGKLDAFREKERKRSKEWADKNKEYLKGARRGYYERKREEKLASRSS